MKKVFVFILSIIFMFSFTSALAKTEQELIEILNQTRLELTQYYKPVMEGTLLYSDNNVKMTAISKPYIDEYWGEQFYIDVVIENYTNFNINCWFSNVSINGWTLEGYGEEVAANKKVKGSIHFDYVYNTDLTSAEEIKEIEGTFVYVNTETWDTIGEGTIYWIFE